MIQKTKSCPFCGGKGVLVVSGYRIPDFCGNVDGIYAPIHDWCNVLLYQCRCEACGAYTAIETSPEQAMENWNRRE